MKVRPITSEERQRRALAENVENALAKDVPFIKGKTLHGITITTSETTIHHYLNKSVIGYMVLSQETHATLISVEPVYPPPEDDKERGRQEYKKNNEITLKASSEVNVTLWVF